MKYIEKKYQQLIEDIKSAYDDTARAYEDTCDTLKYHINELKQQLANKDEEIEKLKGESQLQNEINEYNRLEAQNNMNLEDEIARLQAENNRLKKAYSDLEKAYKITIDAPAPAKKNGRKAGSKNKSVVAYCKDCGTYFQAKSKNAKYCSACGKKRAKQSRLKWLAKQKGQK